MEDKMKRFLEEMSKNKEMVKKVEIINEKHSDTEENASALAELANEMGITITKEELLNVTSQYDSGEMSDEELEQVSGGKMVDHYYPRANVYNMVCDCLCVFAGGGTSDDNQKSCGCMIGGGGEFTELGKSRYHDTAPLVCVIAGVGNSYRV